jgi:D-alanyl-D-alanine carboxypeptidase
VVVAREDGVVIASKAPNKKCETGSTAKLMTCWLAQESLGDAQVTLSDYDIQIAQPFVYDRDQPWKTNSASVVAKQCMYVSSNPYAHTLARYVAREKYGATGTDWGDMRNGVRAMQERAVEIGMTNTTFVSPSGLFGPKNGNFTQDFSSNSKGMTNNRSTGNDMMLLTLNAVPAGTHIVGNTFGSPHKFTNIKTGTNERESMLSMIRIKGKTYYIALMAADHTSSQGGTDVKETTAIVNWLWDYVQ